MNDDRHLDGALEAGAVVAIRDLEEPRDDRPLLGSGRRTIRHDEHVQVAAPPQPAHHRRAVKVGRDDGRSEDVVDDLHDRIELALIRRGEHGAMMPRDRRDRLSHRRTASVRASARPQVGQGRTPTMRLVRMNEPFWRNDGLLILSVALPSRNSSKNGW